VLSRVELTFAEPGDTGIQAQLSDFWSGWDDVANAADDPAARTQLLERAQTLASGINQVSNDLDKLRTDSVGQISARVQEVNSTADRIADLNHSIAVAVNAGLSPNGLQDQRDLLVSNLSKMIGVTTATSDAGQVDVFVGGTAIVRGDSSNHLAAVDDTANPIDPSTFPVKVVWEKDGYPATVKGGEVGGLMTAANEVIPRYKAAMDAVALDLRDTVNAVHKTGYGLNGATGLDFFTGSSAKDLAVNATLVSDPNAVGAAGPPPAGKMDATVAQQLAELSGGDAEQSYQSLIVGLGVEAQAATRRVDIQSDISTQVDAARDAEAGVNLDEEMANMIAFQHAYDAAARFLTAVDGLLDTLINRTGLVGR
jgi:flagellar hook-associated protein 1 FlgK